MNKSLVFNPVLLTAGSILCKFQGIDAMRKAKDPVLWFENPCMLDGYTFSLALKFEASWGKFSNVWAFFVLTPGQKDDFVEWPFAKHVRLSLIHAKNEDQEMALPFQITSKTDARCLERPEGELKQKGIY